jgi:DNA-binding transcriptional regulator GbsR (MarR family)
MLKHAQVKLPLVLFGADLVGEMMAILYLVTNKLTFFVLSFSLSISITSASNCIATKLSLLL